MVPVAEGAGLDRYQKKKNKTKNQDSSTITSLNNLYPKLNTKDSKIVIFKHLFGCFRSVS